LERTGAGGDMATQLWWVVLLLFVGLPLAKRLKMTQPAVARLESGEHNPAFPMLLRISEALEIELAIDISPTGQEPQLIGKRAQRNALESFEGNGCTVVVAAA
jgi:transcriptional regulator with XRE-family HTH domain